jgi:hypothetical protein
MYLAISCDIDETDITARVLYGTTSWKFYPRTGVLIANDGESANF